MKTLKASVALAAVAFAFFVLPATTRAQAATKSVTCTDGTKSAGGRGACSGHGGIADAAAAKAAPAPAKSAPAPAKAAAASAKKSAAAPTAKKAAPEKAAPTPPKAAPKAAATKAPTTAKAEGKPTAKCTDGTLSYAKNHTGACSSHGGVAEWLDGTQKKP